MKEMKNVQGESALSSTYKDLVHLSGSVYDAEQLIEYAVLVYTMKLSGVLTDSDYLVLNNIEIGFCTENYIDFSFIEQAIKSYLINLILNFSSELVSPFIRVSGVPEEFQEYVRWFTTTRIVLDELELGKIFYSPYRISTETVVYINSSLYLKGNQIDPEILLGEVPFNGLTVIVQ